MLNETAARFRSMQVFDIVEALESIQQVLNINKKAGKNSCPKISEVCGSTPKFAP